MKIAPVIKKQIWVALYSSPAISALAVTPMFILTKLPLQLYPWAFALSTLLVFIVWVINIGIYAVAGNANWRYTVSGLVCILLAVGLLHGFFVPWHNWRFGSFSSSIHLHLIVFLAVDMVIVILQDLVVTREKNAVIEMENAELRLRNAEAMNLQLMQQIQPHFLFNSLSTLKSLIGVSPEQASEYLVRLSGFLRATLSSHTANVAPVGRELDLCIDYLEMQRIRFGEALQFSIDVPVEVRESRYLPVFSVQLSIENAIKHNALTRERPLSIRVNYRDEWITVINNLQPKRTGVESAGMGLVNLRARYRSLTGDPVRVEQTTDEFSVHIKVFEYENNHH
ncbi:MAG TPA: sensor histidine kinase [Puia sp.]|nr:sensor histidine kinase [Puia sp.]